MTTRSRLPKTFPSIPNDFTHRTIYRSNRFREPTPVERACGIWVDRVGSLHEKWRGMQGLRVLGLYMFVGADSNYGRMESLEYGLLDIAPGDVAFIRPEIPTWYGPRDGDWHQRWVIWGGPGADRLAEWMRMDRRPPIFHGAAAEVRTAQLQLSSLLSFSHPEAVLTREAILRNMIARVFECERHRDVRSPVKDAIDHSVRHLTEHLHSPLDLTNLARLAGMSESRFRRRFHAHTGFSPIRFLIWHRIERAKALLAGGVPIKETAAAVGMPDPFYFMRTFKRETGTTAAAYATAKRGDR